MKFEELRIWDLLPTEPNRDPFFITEEFPQQDRLNRLFTRLKRFDDSSISEEIRKKQLAESVEEIITECDSIVNHYLLLENNPNHYAKAHINSIIAALKAVEMQIHIRLNNEERIQNKFNSFAKAAMSLISVTQELPSEKIELLSGPLATTGREAISHLTPMVRAKTGSTSLSVPDILATTTIISGGGNSSNNKLGHNFNDIRQTFHTLWQVKNLQPLLTFAAYSSLGYRFNHKGEVVQGNDLKIILMNDRITRQNMPAYGGMCIGQNLTFVSIGHVDKGTEFTTNKYGSMLVHELHHHWEESFNESIQLLPYPTPEPSIFRIFSDPNSAKKQQLKKMIAEAKSVKRANNAKILSHSFDGRQQKLDQPSSIFLNLGQYPQTDIVQSCEIVVRISESISDLCALGGYSEEDAIKLLRDSGLNECVSFFLEEQEQIKQACQRVQESSGVIFGTELQPLHEEPQHLEYSSTPLHDVVRADDLTSIREILAKDQKNIFVKDSLGQTALELAMLKPNPALVVEFLDCIHWEELWQEMSKDPNLLRKTAECLIKIAKTSDSELSNRALSIFKNARNLSYRTNGKICFTIFDESALTALDEEVIKKLTNVEDILKSIAEGSITRYDKFGNSFIDYVAKSTLTPDQKSELRFKIEKKI